MKPENERRALSVLEKLVSKPDNNNSFFDVKIILEINNLRSLIDIDCSDFQMIDAISEIRKKTEININDLITAIKAKKASDEKANETTKWDLVIPFNAEINKRKIKINGCDLKVYKYSSIKRFTAKEYAIHVFTDRFHPKEITSDSLKYLLTVSNGASINVAWKKVEPQFKLLKGIYDLCVSYNSWTFMHTNILARTNITHPKYVYGISNSEVATYLEFITSEAQRNFNPLKKKQRVIFDKLIKCLKENPVIDSIEFFLSDLLRLYSEAMDENLFSNSYLRFWQLIERITLSEPRGATNDIKNRIGYFLHEAYDFELINYLDLLIKKRNELVHRGIDNIEIADINLLKNISEKIILWLFSNRKIIKTTKHLESYYNSINKNNLDLEITSKIVIKILRNRGRHKK